MFAVDEVKVPVNEAAAAYCKFFLCGHIASSYPLGRTTVVPVMELLTLKGHLHECKHSSVSSYPAHVRSLFFIFIYPGRPFLHSSVI